MKTGSSRCFVKKIPFLNNVAFHMKGCPGLYFKPE